MLGCEEVVNIFGLEPVDVELLELVVSDVLLFAHVEDSGWGESYSRRLRELSSGMLTASSKQKESRSLER